MRFVYAASALFFLDGMSNLVEAGSCPIANPVDISIGQTVSCGLLPDSSATCWLTTDHSITAAIAGFDGAGISDNVVKVSVSDNASGTEPVVCVQTDSGHVACTYIVDTSNLSYSAWNVPYKNVNDLGVDSIHICGAFKDIGGTIGRCTNVANAMSQSSIDMQVAANAGGGGFTPFPMNYFFTNPSSRHLCARLDSGQVSCAGANNENQVDPRAGISSTQWVDDVVPDSFVLLDSKAVAIGNEHTCAIKTDNTIWCWGQGFDNSNDKPVQVHDGDGVPRAMMAGDGFTCYITNNSLKCFENGGTPVVINVGSNSVYTVWSGDDQSCIQVNDDLANLPTPGSTLCFTSVNAGALIGSPTTGVLDIACAPNENCITTVAKAGDDNELLMLNHIPLDFGDDAKVESGDLDSYFGLTYSFHPEQFTPPGMHTAMFAYIVPVSDYTSSTMDVSTYGCVLAHSQAPFSTRVHKRCFDYARGGDGAKRDTYTATVIMRTCMLNTCSSYPHADNIFGASGIDASQMDIFTKVDALDNLVSCPFISELTLTITVPIGNLVETSDSITLNWARDDVTDAEADDAESAVAVNDDLSKPVEWGICDRAINTAYLDSGYDFGACFDYSVSTTGNSRVVQLTKIDANADGVPFNQLAMGFRLHPDDQRLVSAGHLTFVPEKTSLNLFHSQYGTGLKTGARCLAAGTGATNGCTQVLFSTGATGGSEGDYQIYTNVASAAQYAIKQFEVGFRGELPEFDLTSMGCGVGGNFCTIVMELTFEMGEGKAGSTITRRLVKRQVEMPMRFLQDSSGLDYQVALAGPDPADEQAVQDNDTGVDIVTTGAAAAGLGFVVVGAVVMMRRGGKDEEQVPSKGYDVEANRAGGMTIS